MTIFRIIEVQFFGLSVVLKSPACAKLQNVSGQARTTNKDIKYIKLKQIFYLLFLFISAFICNAQTRNTVINIIDLKFDSLRGQTFEYVYKNKNDSSYNCYLKVIPNSKQIKGLVIRDFSTLPDISKASPYQFTYLCTEEDLMTIYTVSSNKFPEFFISDAVISILDDIVSEVIKEHKIPDKNIFIGGISASGTRALRYAQYCEQGKSKYGIKIKGVFSVDSPLDLARFYESVHSNRNNFKAGMKWEADLMNNVFEQLFSGSPNKFENQYLKASVFSHKDSLGGNAQYLKNVNIIVYHEPDIDWWLKERGSSYFDINSYDIAAFVLKLWSLTNKSVEIVTTTNKGYDRNGNRNCHSWTIVDEVNLIRWIKKQIE